MRNNRQFNYINLIFINKTNRNLHNPTKQICLPRTINFSNNKSHNNNIQKHNKNVHIKQYFQIINTLLCKLLCKSRPKEL